MRVAKLKDLAHIPGSSSWPLFGNFFALVFNTLNFGIKLKEKHGSILQIPQPKNKLPIFLKAL